MASLYVLEKGEIRRYTLSLKKDTFLSMQRMRQSFHHIWMKSDKPYLMELSLVKIIEKWVYCKLMLCVILEITSQNEGVGVWKNAQMLVDALRKSMVAVCLANVLRNVWTNSIKNYKSLLGKTTFSQDFLSNKNLVKQQCLGNCGEQSNQCVPTKVMPYATIGIMHTS